MGTNFYFFTNDKSIAKKYASDKYTLTDTPEFGYEIHIAKTSCGWLPLFQYRETMPSVKAMKEAYDTGKFKIYDEYNKEYNWKEFDERVLKFNGGIKGAIKPQPFKSFSSIFHGIEENENIPISHFDYSNGNYSHLYLKDEDGYEFSKSNFC